MKKLAISLLSFTFLTSNMPHYHFNAVNSNESKNQALSNFFRYSFSVCLESLKDEGYSPINEKCHGELGDFREELYFIPDQKSQLPFVKISKKDEVNELLIEDIFIYIHGGPLYSFPRLYQYEDKYDGLNNKQAVYIPLYLGTWFRSTGHGAKDLAGAVSEVQIALSGLRTIHPNARVHVIGQSWGAYVASRLDLLDGDQLVLESAPLNHTGESLLSFFFNRISPKRQNSMISFPLDATDFSKQLEVKRFDYLASALEYVGEEKFVLNKRFDGNVCRIVIYGTKDPMVSDFHKPSGYDPVAKEWVIKRETGHDVLEGYHGFFSQIVGINCP